MLKTTDTFLYFALIRTYCSMISISLALKVFQNNVGMLSGLKQCIIRDNLKRTRFYLSAQVCHASPHFILSLSPNWTRSSFLVQTSTTCRTYNSKFHVLHCWNLSQAVWGGMRDVCAGTYGKETRLFPLLEQPIYTSVCEKIMYQCVQEIGLGRKRKRKQIHGQESAHIWAQATEKVQTQEQARVGAKESEHERKEICSSMNLYVFKHTCMYKFKSVYVHIKQHRQIHI